VIRSRAAPARRLGLIVLLGVIALSAGGCGEDELSLTEYAAEAEALVNEMNQRLDRLDAGNRQATPSIAGTVAYHRERAATRLEFLDAFEEIDPPESAIDLHAETVDIITKLAGAQTALADRAAAAESVHELAALMDSPEGRAFFAIDEQAVALCRSAQAQMDATGDREIFEGTPWVPAELREVVVVALRCTVEERAEAQP
jgi:hypothetical protein